MKTAEEKAHAFAARHNLSSEKVDALATLLREQDRETRQACAETVTREIYRQYELRGTVTENGICAISDACMNAKAV